MERLEVAGHWWLPENESNKVAGILTFDLRKGGQLALIGAFRRAVSAADRENLPAGVTAYSAERYVIDSNYGRLHGLAGGKSFTLEGCFRQQTRGSFGKPYEEKVYVNGVYEGIQIPDGEEASGDLLDFSVDGLSEWIARSGLSQIHHSGVPDGETCVELHGALVPLRVAPLPDEGEIRIGHRLNSQTPASSASLTESFSIQLRFPSKVPVEDLIDLASDFQDLVSIATGRTAQFGEIQVGHPEVFREVNGERFPLKYTIWSAWTALRDDQLKPLNRFDLFFNLEDIGGIDALTAWMAVARKYRSALGRTMATRYSQDGYLSDRLLNRAAALEGFDRIDTGISNGRTFAQRIRRCVDLAGPRFAEVVYDPEKWITELKDQRNEIAHHYGRRMRQAVEEQLYLADGAYWLLVFCLLKETGVADPVFDHIAAHRKLKHLARKHQEMFS